MLVPVTVTASVVVARLPFDFGCANANGASSAQQTMMVIGFFMLSLLLVLMVARDGWFSLYKGIPERVLHEI